MGLPGDMVPGLNDPISGLPYANTDFGLAFHSDSAHSSAVWRPA